MQYDTQIPGNVGARPRPVEFILTIATGVTVTKGKVYTLDKTTATAANFGVAKEARDVLALDALQADKTFVVALENGTAGQAKRFAVRGWVEVTMKAATTGTADVGQGVDATGTLTPANVEGAKVVAVAPETVTAGTTGYFWFDGDGFGTYAESTGAQ